eukprot:TRINITY_DN5331_c0_g1_i1.p1 TRINITY_DN5331_c0_g1~~TRINITY_DN5331_c0_g1_i1.p1  ORF type:complete len:136 (-),score=35.52 TRINITY_DN5331_c0_g1_i1:84-491(-)
MDDMNGPSFELALNIHCHHPGRNKNKAYNDRSDGGGIQRSNFFLKGMSLIFPSFRVSSVLPQSFEDEEEELLRLEMAHDAFMGKIRDVVVKNPIGIVKGEDEEKEEEDEEERVIEDQSLVDEEEEVEEEEDMDFS